MKSLFVCWWVWGLCGVVWCVLSASLLLGGRVRSASGRSPCLPLRSLSLSRWLSFGCIQVVLKCGKMAVNFEHSFSDGMDWTRMLSEVRKKMRGGSPDRYLFSVSARASCDAGWTQGTNQLCMHFEF